MFRGYGHLFVCAAIVAMYAHTTRGAALLTFDPNPNGKVINNQYYASNGVSISADNFTVGHPGHCDHFRYQQDPHHDADLQQPWDGGNRVGNNFPQHPDHR